MSVIWNSVAVAEGMEAIGLCREDLHSRFKDLLDHYHGVPRSRSYYDVLAGDWLELFAHVTYAAWREVLMDNVPADLQPIPVFPDLAQTPWQDSELHRHLRSVVASLLNGSSPDRWKFECESALIASGSSERLPKRLLRDIATAKSSILVTAPYFKCSRREWVGALWYLRRLLAWDDLQYPIRIRAELDSKWRKAQAFAPGPATNLNELLQVLLPLYLPVVLLEGFTNYRNAVLNLPIARPKAVYSANALHFHLTFKLLAAEWRQHGTLLLYHQCGGGYGQDRIHIIEEFETRVSDRYYTWGWRRGEPHVKPLSAPPPNAPSRLRKRLMLCCGDFLPVVYRLQYSPMPGTIQTVHLETCKFLATLPERRNLLVRPYPENHGWGAVDMMRKTAPDATFDDHSVRVFVRYAESRLVVHNYLSTGYLETLALNIPTVCFFDPDTYAFRRAAQPLIDALERVGVLHRSGTAAARFVSGLGHNPETWWNQPDVQEARQNFIDHHANFSLDWKKQWKCEFEAVLDGAG